MGWVEMSERELRRAEVLASVYAGRLTMTAAAGLMGVTRRQAHRLARLFAESSDLLCKWRCTEGFARGVWMAPLYAHPSLAERCELFRLRSTKIPMQLTVQQLKRHPSTLYPEIRRSYFHSAVLKSGLPGKGRDRLLVSCLQLSQRPADPSSSPRSALSVRDRTRA
jgi:hypothetical protein